MALLDKTLRGLHDTMVSLIQFDDSLKDLKSSLRIKYAYFMYRVSVTYLCF